MKKSGKPVRAGKRLSRKKQHPRQELTLEQLRDAAALDKWLTEHEVAHKDIAEMFGTTEGIVSHHRNGRTAITEVWMMRYAAFFDTVPQVIFPSWRWSCMTPGNIPPSLAGLIPLWNNLQHEQREQFSELLRREARGKRRG